MIVISHADDIEDLVSLFQTDPLHYGPILNNPYIISLMLDKFDPLHVIVQAPESFKDLVILLRSLQRNREVAYHGVRSDDRFTINTDTFDTGRKYVRRRACETFYVAQLYNKIWELAIPVPPGHVFRYNDGNEVNNMLHILSIKLPKETASIRLLSFWEIRYRYRWVSLNYRRSELCDIIEKELRDRGLLTEY